MVEELKRELGEAEKRKNPENTEGNEAMHLRYEVANMERGQQPNFFSKGTELEHLKEYVEDMDKRIALIAPHCDLKKLDMSR